MSPELKFAIIGCGRIAPRHAENILKTGQLIAVCDIIPEKAHSLAAVYHATPYTSIEQLLQKENNLDVVVICTPNGLHAGHSIMALEAGFHVICEKPMCLTTADAKAMKKAADVSGKTLFIVKQNRYNPPVAVLKEMLSSGRLGRIISVQVNGFWNRPAKYFENSWKGTKELDGGILFTQFSHFIDLAVWLAGDVKEIKAICKNFLLEKVIETEDNLVAVCEFNNGAIGSFHFSVSAYEKNMEGSLTIIAERGIIKIGGQYLNTLEYVRVEGEKPVITDKSNPPNNYGYYEGSMSNHDKVYENFIKSLHHPDVNYPGAGDGMKTVEIIERIYASCK